MENGTKKQELFNWFFCTFVSCFSHFQNAVFSIFSKCIFKTHFFDFFHMFCLKMRLENMEKLCFENVKEKRETNVKQMLKKNTCEHPVGRVELWFFWVQFCCSCCLPNFCRLKIGEEQFKSIGSGLCRSQICLIYL